MSVDIHVAAKNGDVAAIAEYIRAGGNLDVEDGQGNRPLHVASRHGQEESVAALLGAGVDPSAVNGSGQTPLYFAAANGHHGCASLLQGRPMRTFRQSSRLERRVSDSYPGRSKQASSEDMSDKHCHRKDRAKSKGKKHKAKRDHASPSSREKAASGTSLVEAPDADERAGADERADARDPQQQSTWCLYYDEANKAYYYYDHFSGESIWVDGTEGSDQGFFQHVHLQSLQHRAPDGWSIHNDPSNGHLYYVHDYSRASVWAESDGSFPWRNFSSDGQLLPVPPSSGGSPVQAACIDGGASASGPVVATRPEPSAPPMPTSMLSQDFHLGHAGDGARLHASTYAWPSTAGFVSSDESSGEREAPSAGGMMVPPVPASRSGGVRSGIPGPAGRIKDNRASDREEDGQSDVPTEPFEGRTYPRQPQSSNPPPRGTNNILGGLIPFHLRYADATSLEDLTREVNGIRLTLRRWEDAAEGTPEERNPLAKPPVPPIPDVRTDEEAYFPCPPPARWVTGGNTRLSGGSSSVPTAAGQNSPAAMPTVTSPEKGTVEENTTSCPVRHMPTMVWRSGPESTQPVQRLEGDAPAGRSPRHRESSPYGDSTPLLKEPGHLRDSVVDSCSMGPSKAVNKLLGGSVAAVEGRSSAAGDENSPESSSRASSEGCHLYPGTTPPDPADSV